MFKNLRCTYQICVIGIALTVCCHAEGVKFLAQESDAIVIGTVERRQEGPTKVTFNLAVLNVFKGKTIPQTVTISHAWTGLIRGGDREIGQTLTGMWFLKKLSTGDWDVLPARPSMHGSFLELFLPAIDEESAVSIPEGDLPTRLLMKVASAVRVQFDDSADVLIGALDGASGASVAEIIPTLLISSDDGTQIAASAMLFSNQLPQAIEQLLRVWPRVKGNPARRHILAAIRDSWRTPTADDITKLIDLAGRDEEIKAVAEESIASIHSSAALPFLARILFEGDPASQSLALYGISAFANGCPVRSKENVVTMQYLNCTEPSKYRTQFTMDHFVFRRGTAEQQRIQVSYWAEWWKLHPELH